MVAVKTLKHDTSIPAFHSQKDKFCSICTSNLAGSNVQVRADSIATVCIEAISTPYYCTSQGRSQGCVCVCGRGGGGWWWQVLLVAYTFLQL